MSISWRIALFAVGVAAVMAVPSRAQSPRNAAYEPGAVAAEQVRARRLAEAVAGTVKLLDEGNPQGRLDQMSAAAAGSWAHAFLKRMQACQPLWAGMLAAARENRPGDLAMAALKGHLVVDGLIGDVWAKGDQLEGALLKVLSSKRPDVRKMEAAQRELEISSALSNYLIGALDTFDVSLQAIVEWGPAESRRQAFAAIANERGAAHKTRARLDSPLRLGYAAEDDPTAKTAAAARMAELGVPLTEPSPTPATAASPSAN